MNFSNRIVENPDRFKLVKADGTEETVRLLRDEGNVLQEGSEITDEFFRSKANSVGIDLISTDLSASEGRVYYLGKTVFGVLSGNATAVLTNCEGEITVSGSSAKVYLENCPFLTVNLRSTDNADGFGQVFRNGKSTAKLFSGKQITNFTEIVANSTVLAPFILPSNIRPDDVWTIEYAIWKRDFSASQQSFTCAFSELNKSTFTFLSAWILSYNGNIGIKASDTGLLFTEGIYTNAPAASMALAIYSVRLERNL